MISSRHVHPVASFTSAFLDDIHFRNTYTGTFPALLFWHGVYWIRLLFFTNYNFVSGVNSEPPIQKHTGASNHPLHGQAPAKAMVALPVISRIGISLPSYVCSEAGCYYCRGEGRGASLVLLLFFVILRLQHLSCGSSGSGKGRKLFSPSFVYHDL